MYIADGEGVLDSAQSFPHVRFHILKLVTENGKEEKYRDLNFEIFRSFGLCVCVCAGTCVCVCSDMGMVKG